MMDVKRLKHTAVVTIQSGERLGAISDVHIDLEQRQIASVVVQMEGRSGSSAAVVPMSQIQAIGADAVMIPDRESVQLEPSPIDTGRFPDLKRLTSLKVVTDAGTHEGRVETVSIDEQTGRLTEVVVAPPGIGRLWKRPMVVPIDQVISMGRDLVVIPEHIGIGGTPPETSPEAHPESGEQAGGA